VKASRGRRSGRVLALFNAFVFMIDPFSRHHGGRQVHWKKSQIATQARGDHMVFAFLCLYSQWRKIERKRSNHGCETLAATSAPVDIRKFQMGKEPVR
jgi:hypothetical protein